MEEKAVMEILFVFKILCLCQLHLTAKVAKVYKMSQLNAYKVRKAFRKHGTRMKRIYTDFNY